MTREWPPENKVWFDFKYTESHHPIIVLRVSGDIRNERIGPRKKEISMDLSPWQLDQIIDRAQYLKTQMGG